MNISNYIIIYYSIQSNIIISVFIITKLYSPISFSSLSKRVSFREFRREFLFMRWADIVLLQKSVSRVSYSWAFSYYTYISILIRSVDKYTINMPLHYWCGMLTFWLYHNFLFKLNVLYILDVAAVGNLQVVWFLL